MHRDRLLVVRAGDADAMALAAAVPPERLLWIETSLEQALAAPPGDAPLDVVLSDPGAEAPRLYALARLHGTHRVRVTLPVRPGVRKAGLLAVSLRLPVRLLPCQPAPELVAELEPILDRYLHDPAASEPVEFFHSALARLLHGDPRSLWQALELDPSGFQRIPADDGEGPFPLPPREPGFVAAHVARLLGAGAECAACPSVAWCGGLFKWPDPGYSCGAVRGLLGLVEESAAAIRRDLAELEGR